MENKIVIIIFTILLAGLMTTLLYVAITQVFNKPKELVIKLLIIPILLSLLITNMIII